MVGLVTGANRGLGYELTKLGLEEGHIMIATYRSELLEGADLLRLKEGYGEQLVLEKMDVINDAEVARAAANIAEQHPVIDFIINNAGVLYESRFTEKDAILDLDIDMLRSTLDINAVGPAIVLKYFMPMVYQSKEGCIINITSEGAHLSPGGYQYLAYSMSKHALNMYTQQIRNYLVEKQSEKAIRIYMIHPGRLDTIMGKENAQMSPVESAVGIFNILHSDAYNDLEIPFINYKGELMPY